MTPISLPPKLSVPQLDQVIDRERLFAQLDQRLTGTAVVWLEGMAGAGKTVLAASYVARRRLPAIWYRLDAGDADPAAFFHDLARAWRELLAGKKFRPLPVLSAEYLADPEGFARDFFRIFFDYLPAPAVIVFDDYQALPPQAPLHRLLSVMVSEARPPTGILALSRRPPPPEFSRWRVSHRLWVLTQEALRLTWEEFRELAVRCFQATLTDQELRTLYDRSGGWSAGAVLLLLGQSGPARAVDAQPVFAYLADEIFDQLRPPLQDFLLKTAALPYFDPELARRLTGHPEAAGLLATLVREHGFTEHLSDGAYRYHELFREFLQARARVALSEEQRRALSQAAAPLLAAQGAVADAVALLAEAEAWDELAALLRAQAPTLAAQGYYGLLEQGLRRLPAAWLAADPWLPYWLGIVRLPFDMTEARAWLVQAYRAFRNGGESASAVAAWAAIVDSYALEFADFSPLDDWIAEADRLAAGELAGLPAASRHRFALGMFTALVCRQPDRPDIQDWADQVEDQIRACPDPEQRLRLGCQLGVYYLAWRGRRDQAERLLARLAPRDETGLTPMARLMWRYLQGWSRLAAGDMVQCLQAAAEGVALANQFRLRFWVVPMRAKAFYACLWGGDLGGARGWLDRVGEEHQPARRLEEIIVQFMTALYALHQGDAALAAEHARHGAEDARRIAGPHYAALLGLVHAFACARLGDAESARRELHRAQAAAAGMGLAPLSFNAGLLEALLAGETGDNAAAVAALRRAFLTGRQMNCYYSAFWPRPVLAGLCARALAAGVEPDYATALIRTYRLPPPPAADLEAWRWPLRIYGLGCFEILRDGLPLRFTGKAPQRPLALLKALIALGGRDVSAPRLAALLWPESEGDQAYHALEMALHRLRLQLGFEPAVTLHSGALTLHPDWVWTDVGAFEQLAATLGAADLAAGDIAALSTRLLELYQGDLFSEDMEAEWLWPRREQLRARFRRAVAALCEALASTGQWRQIVDLCETALSRGSYTEECCRRLLEAYGQLEDIPLLIETYRRCERLLALQGLTPSPKTTDLYRRLLGSSRPPSQ